MFVTAAAPVIDSRTGQVLLTVGMDVEASVWRAKVRLAQWIPFLLTLVPLLLLSAGYLLMEWRLSLAPEQHRWLRNLEVIICAVIMLLLTGGAGGLVYHAEKLSRENAFYTLAQFKAEAFVEAVNGVQTRLNTMVRLFESDSPVSREDFRSYKILVRKGCVQAYAWLPAVSAADALEFTAKACAMGCCDFSIWQMTGENTPIPAQGDLFYPVLYIESLADNGKTLGCDACSDVRLRAAIQEALRTDRAAASEPFKLTMLADAPTGFFVFKPVAGKLHTGMVAFVVQPEALLTGQPRTPSVDAPDFFMNLFELRAGEPPRTLVCSEETNTQSCWLTAQSGMHITLPVFAFGKMYGLTITPGTQWLAAHPLHNGLFMLFFGLVLTLLLTSLISMLTRRSAGLENVVQQRTTALRESDEKYRQLAESAGVILWEYDLPSDHWTYVAPQVEQLLGYKPEEWTNLAFWETHIHEEDREQAAADCASCIERGENSDFEYRFIAKDGRTVWLYDAVHVTMKAGRPVKLSGFTMDITARKQTEKNLQTRNEELERFNQAATGRELRMIALKEEINDLRRQLGQDASYAIPNAEPEPALPELQRRGWLKNLFGRGRPHES